MKYLQEKSRLYVCINNNNPVSSLRSTDFTLLLGFQPITVTGQSDPIYNSHINTCKEQKHINQNLILKIKCGCIKCLSVCNFFLLINLWHSSQRLKECFVAFSLSPESSCIDLRLHQLSHLQTNCLIYIFHAFCSECSMGQQRFKLCAVRYNQLRGDAFLFY